MGIRFYEVEEKTFDGRPLKREYFEADCGDPILRDGRVSEPKAIGLVDDAIIKQHPLEYTAYKKSLEAQGKGVKAPAHQDTKILITKLPQDTPQQDVVPHDTKITPTRYDTPQQDALRHDAKITTVPHDAPHQDPKIPAAHHDAAHDTKISKTNNPTIETKGKHE